MFFFPLRVITAVYFVFLFLDLFIIDIEIPYSTDKVSLDKQKKTAMFSTVSLRKGKIDIVKASV